MVPSLTSVCSPPMTPASAIGPEGSQISRSSEVSLRSTPSKVVIISPGLARLTMICPSCTRS